MLHIFQALKKVHETFESDMSAEMSRVAQLESISQELESLNYANSDSVNARLEGIKETLSNLQNLSNDRSARIDAGIEAQQRLDGLRLEYAKLAAVSNTCSFGGDEWVARFKNNNYDFAFI